jgi:cell division protein FtsB
MRYSIVAVLTIGLLLFFQYRLWFGEGGMRDMRLLKENLTAQLHENDTLQKRNDELLMQIQTLQKSKDAAEARARNELGMIKKDETFYQIVK